MNLETKIANHTMQVLDAMFNQHKPEPQNRRTENLRRIIEDADIQYEQRVNPDRRIHGAECMAGICTCYQEGI